MILLFGEIQWHSAAAVQILQPRNVGNRVDDVRPNPCGTGRKFHRPRSATFEFAKLAGGKTTNRHLQQVSTSNKQRTDEQCK